MIKAGTSERGCCPKCGKQWVRVIEKGYRAPAQEDVIAEMVAKGVPRQKANLYGNPIRDPKLYAENPDKTIGWQPSCSCYDDLYRTEYPQARSSRKRYQQWVAGYWWKRVRKMPGLPHWKVEPCKVLDPFAGSGTTGRVAARLRRRFVGLELNPAYIELARERIGETQIEML